MDMATSSPPASGNPAARLWSWLTTPHPAVPADERQKASILMSMLAVFVPLAFVVVFNGPITSFINGTEGAALNIAAVVALGFVIAAYAISRTSRYQIAGYMVVLVPILAVVGVFMSSQEAPTPVSLFFLSLSAIFCGLLFDARQTIIVGVISAVIAVAAYYRPIANPVPVSWPIPMFILISASVMAVVSYLTQGYVSRLETTQRQLREQYTVAEEARERAERSDQVKSAFLASMSHELRTPLNAIINYTKFVNKGTMGPVTPAQVETLDEVIDSAKHLLNLINDVLDMSKIEAGSLSLFIEDNIDLKAVLISSLNTAKALGREKELNINLLMPEDLPNVRGDRQRILQAVLNVVSNAVKFTEVGSVTIKATHEGGSAVIEISDTGPGIAAQDQFAVFEAFKQTKTGLRQAGGTGLGMPITKSLIEAHGGTISLKSEEGQGATFTLKLPIKSEQLVPMA
ncbi:MAG: HAMP domain-containing histidine kinase [Anaerolineae bacterium]|jgi:signal transduction histidine kinase|nr:HAMP domain-containing histidine kinase [Anaerolineae bacterium]